MKRWEITAMDGTKLTIDADNIDITPSGVAIFLLVSDTLRDDKGKPRAEICGLAGNTFKVIKTVPMPLVDVTAVTDIKTGSVHVTI